MSPRGKTNHIMLRWTSERRETLAPTGAPQCNGSTKTTRGAQTTKRNHNKTPKTLYIYIYTHTYIYIYNIYTYIYIYIYIYTYI